MQYKIEQLVFSYVSRGWILEIGVRFPTDQQYTWENKNFSNLDSELKPSHSVLVTFLKFWWFIRKEIKLRQAMPGAFKICS